MSYNPQVPPTKSDELLPYLQDEFFKVAQEFNPRLEGEWELMHELPERVRPGMVQYFDGVNADPLGTGQEGLYRYGTDNKWHWTENVVQIIPEPPEPPKPPAPGPWTSFTPAAPWGSAGTNFYRKNPFSVTLILAASEGSTSKSGQVLLYLPVGFRPPATIYFPAAAPSFGNMSTLGAFPYVQVNPDGAVIAQGFNKGMLGFFATVEIPIGSYD